MNIFDRAKNILFSPKTEWPVIAGEPSSTGDVMKYAAILGLIPALMGLIGSVMFVNSVGINLGFGFYLVNFTLNYLMGLGVIYLMGIIAGALASSFAGTNSSVAGLKLVVYSGTALWVAGFLAIIPALGLIAVLVGLVYAGYLISIGAPPVLKIPSDKVFGYVAVLVVTWLVVAMILSWLVNAIAWALAGPTLTLPVYS